MLMAAILSGVTVYLALAALTGRAPRLRRTTAGAAGSRHRAWLAQAGVDVSPRQFLLGSVSAGAVAFVVGAMLTRAPAVAIVPAVAVALLPRAYFARRRATRLRRLQEAWPDGLRDVIAAVSAGHSLHAAVAALAEHGPEPLGEAFSRYPLLARVLGVVPALELVKEELADPTSDRVIEVLVLTQERGGSLLPEILRDLADATTKDVRTLEEIETDALEQRINARAVFVLPWIVLLVLTLQNGPFREFYRSTGGVLVVIAGGVMSTVGAWLVGRLSRDPEEERVFGGSMPRSRWRGREEVSP
ncbi:MAG: type II secretion system F family protein [Nitriliruptorales bacterium]